MEEVDVLQLKIGGQELPFRIRFYAIMKFENEYNVKVDELFASGDQTLEQIAKMMYYGLEAGHKAEKKDFDLEFDDVLIMLDSHLNEFMGAFTHFMNESKTEKKEQPAPQE